MKDLLIYIRQKFIPRIIKFLINYTILIWKTWKLNLGIRTYLSFSPINLLKGFIKIDNTVCWSFSINLSWKVKIDKFTKVNWPGTFLLWSNIYKIKIWKFCSIAPNVTIISSNWHDYNKLTITPPKNKIVDLWWDVNIWNDVWLWANVVVLPWVSIWDWAIIWAWSIVNKDIEKYTVSVWNPCKTIKYRFDEKRIKKIEKSKWWESEINEVEKLYDII